jgi:CBS domain-containing protein
MRRHDVSHLPVVDRCGVVVGILSPGDLLGEFMREDKVIREDVLTEVLAHRIEEPDVIEGHRRTRRGQPRRPGPPRL